MKTHPITPDMDWAAADRYERLRIMQRAHWAMLQVREARRLWRVGLGILVALAVFSYAYVELLTWEPFK